MSLIKDIDRAAADALIRGARPSRLELTPIDAGRLLDELQPLVRGPVVGSFFDGVCTLATVAGPLRISPAMTSESAVCWRRPGRIGRYEVVPWNRQAINCAMPEIPTPYVDTEAEQPDSPELAALYEERAAEMEQEAADARSPQQAEGLRLGAGSFRRKAAGIRARLEGRA